MKNVSNLFKEELNKGNRNYLLRAEIYLNDMNETLVEVRNKHIWSNGFSIESNVSSPSSFDIGSAIINKATVVINNIYEEFSQFDFFRARVILFVGLELPDKRIEELPLGMYTVDEAKYNGSLITLECLDFMAKFDKKYSLSKLTYPANLNQIVRDACVVCGVSLGAGLLSNGDYIVDERPSDEALTFRQVLSWVGQIACVWFKMNERGQLTHGWYDRQSYESMSVVNAGKHDTVVSDTISGGTLTDTTGDAITGASLSDYKNVHVISSLNTMTLATDDVVITGLRVDEYNKESHDKVVFKEVGTAEYMLHISNNKLILPGKAGVVARMVSPKIIGLRFRPLNVTFRNNPTIEPGDPALVIDYKGNTYQTLITGTRFQVGASQMVECGARSPQRNSADRFSKQTQSYLEAYKEIAKEKTQRELAIENLNNTLKSSSGMYMTSEPQPNGSSITYLHDKRTLAESMNIIKITSEAVGVSNDGGNTYPHGFLLNGDIIARLLYAVGIDANYIMTGIISDMTQTNYWDLETGELSMMSMTAFVDGIPLEKFTQKEAAKIEMGGKNLLQRIVICYGGSREISDTEIEIDGSASDVFFHLKPHHDLKSGQEYTLSFDAQGVPTGCKWEFYINGSLSPWKFKIDRNGRISTTGILNSDILANRGISIDDVPGTKVNAKIRLSNFRLDRGVKAFDYAPAPEDIEQGIADLDQKLADPQEVFNRLTNNGKVQGLAMQNGNLYINATYIKSGILTLGGANNVNGWMRVLDASGQTIGEWSQYGLTVKKGNIYCKTEKTGVAMYGGQLLLSYGDVNVGYIGTNQYVQDASQKGITFDLENDGSYMSWSARVRPTDRTFTMLWSYCRNNLGVYRANTLNAGCEIDMHNHILSNVKLENIMAANGYNGWTGTIPIVTKIENGMHWVSTINVSNGIITSAPQN